MADENQCQAFIRVSVAGAVRSARTATGLMHRGITGAGVERLVRDLFRPPVPMDIGVGNRQISQCATGRLPP